MKKLMYAIGLGLIAGSVWAACSGPFCFDDTGASIQSKVGIAGPMTFGQATKAQINALTASTTYQVLLCTDCTTAVNAGNGMFNLCVATGSTTNNQYAFINSTGTVCK